MKALVPVLRNVKERLRRNISLLRLDSLVWQVGKIMYGCNYAKSCSIKGIQRYMVEKVELNGTLASKFANELTKFIEKVDINYE